MKIEELRDMLLDSAKIVHGILTNPTEKDMETTKILIAGANTLAQTVKTMIQAEVIELKLGYAKENTNLIIHRIVNKD